MGIIEFKRPPASSRFTDKPEVAESLDTIQETFSDISNTLRELDGFGGKIAHTLLMATDPFDLGPRIGTSGEPRDDPLFGIEHELGGITGVCFGATTSPDFSRSIGHRVIATTSYGYAQAARPVHRYRPSDRDPSLLIHDVAIPGKEGVAMAIARIAIHGPEISTTAGLWAQRVLNERIHELKKPLQTLRDAYIDIDNPPLSFLRSLELATPIDPNCHVIEFDVVQSTDTMLDSDNGTLDTFLGTLKNHAARFIQNGSFPGRAAYIGNGGDNVRIAFEIPRSIDRANTASVESFLQRHVTPAVQSLQRDIQRINHDFPEFELHTREATGFIQHESSGEYTVIPLWEIAKDRKNK